jgi:hypothetical protein
MISAQITECTDALFEPLFVARRFYKKTDNNSLQKKKNKTNKTNINSPSPRKRLLKSRFQMKKKT